MMCIFAKEEITTNLIFKLFTKSQLLLVVGRILQNFVHFVCYRRCHSIFIDRQYPLDRIKTKITINSHEGVWL